MCDKTLRGKTVAKAVLTAAAAGAPMPKSWGPASRSSQSDLRKSARGQILNTPCFFAKTLGQMNVSVELKSGSQINLITESAADQFGFDVIVDNFGFSDYFLGDEVLLTSLVDQTQIVGLTSFKLVYEGYELWFDGVVVQDDYLNDACGDIVAGAPFMEQNDISVRPSKRQIMFGDDITCSYGSASPQTQVDDLSLACLHDMEDVVRNASGCLTSDGQHDYDSMITDHKGCEMKLIEQNDLTDEECEMKVIESNDDDFTDECEMKVRSNNDLIDEECEMKVIESNNDLIDEECEMKVIENNSGLTDERCEMKMIECNNDLAHEECEMKVTESTNGLTDEESEMKVIGSTNDITDEGCKMKVMENRDLGDERCEMKMIDRPNKDLGDERCEMKMIDRPNKDLGVERCEMMMIYRPNKDHGDKRYEMKVIDRPNKEGDLKEVISEDGASGVSTAKCDDHTGFHDGIAPFVSMSRTPYRVLCSSGVDLSLESSMVVRNCGQSAVCDCRFIESVGLGSSLDHDSGTLPDVMSNVSVNRCSGSNCSVDCECVVGPHCWVIRRIGDTNLSIDRKDVLGPHCPLNIRRVGDTNLSVVALSDPKLPDGTCSSRIVSDGGIVAPPCLSNLHRDSSLSVVHSHLPAQTTCCMNAKLLQYRMPLTVAFTECPHFANCPFHSILYDSSLLTPVTPHTRPPDQPHAATEHGPAVQSALVEELCSLGDATSASLILPAKGPCYQQLYSTSPSECMFLQDSSDVFPYRKPSVRPTRHIMRG